MNNDRFTDFDDEVKQLVLDFERTVMRGESQFYDIDELEMIIDYYLEVDDKEPLISAIHLAERLYPDSIEVKIRRAHWYVLNKENTKALSLLQSLERQDPSDTDVAYSLGVVYGEMGESRKAIQYYLRAAADGWQLGRIYANIAEEYVRLQQWHDAIQYYMQAFRTDSYDEQTLYNYLDTCEEADACDEACEFLELYVNDHPYSKIGWYCYGCVCRDLGLAERAVDAFEYALAIDKNYASAYYELALANEQLDRIGEAATALTRALDAVSLHGDIYRALGQLFLRHDNFDTALLYLRKAVDENPADAEALAGIGLCHLYLGDDTSALASARKALAVDPQCPDALFCSALVYDGRDNVDAASDFYERLVASPRANEGHCRFYTLFLFKHAIYDILIEFAEESLQLYPHDLFYSSYLAAAYFYTNRYNRFRRLLADVQPSLLRQLCPQAWDNQALAPLLAALHDDSPEPES